MTISTRGYGQTDQPTDRPTDIATYRAAIAAKNLVGGRVSNQVKVLVP